MSSSIDERIVKLGFTNAQFENGVKTSLKTLEDLKKGLKLDDAAKGLSDLSKAGRTFSLGNIADAVTGLSNRFSTLGIIGLTAIQNITNSVINMGKKLIDAIAIAPIRTGLQEYETQINAIQTILANTSMKGTTLPQVMAALDDLNTYADKTIYNFTEMTRNIGTFTAAGVDLDTSVSAIKGIANLAAVSGSNAQQAATAMYQLSQALSSGTVKLMDWNSVVNAGMGGQVFQDALKETARVHGVQIDAMIKKEGSFRETLSNGWLTSQILTETLAKFTGDLGEAQLKSLGYTDEQIKKIQELGQMANDAATKVKTFTQLKDTVAEAIQSTWTKTWTLIIGDFGEAKSLFTQISDAIGVQVEKMGKSRNDLLEGWRMLGGREALVATLRALWGGLINVMETFSEVINTIFPPTTASQLYNLTVIVMKAAQAFKAATEDGDRLARIFKGVAAPFQILGSLIGAVVRGLAQLAGVVIGPLATGFDLSLDGILNFLASLGDSLVAFKDWIDTNDIFNKGIEKIGQGLGIASYSIQQFITTYGPEFTRIWGEITTFVAKAREEIQKFVDIAGPKVTKVFNDINTFVEPAKKSLQEFAASIGPAFEQLKSTLSTEVFGKLNFKGVGDDISSFGDKVKEAVGPLNVILEKIGKVFEWLGKVFEKLGPIFASVGAALGTAFSKIGEVILNVLDNIDFNKVAELIKSGLLAALILAVRNFIQNGAEAMGGVSEILEGVKDSLEAWQNSLKAKTLLQIAIAIGILAVSLMLLSTIDTDKLYTGLTIMTVMFGELVGSLKVLEKAKGSSLSTATAQLLLLAAGLIVMSIAVEKLSKVDPERMMQGLIGVGALLGELAIFMKISGKGDLGKTAGLLTLAVGLLILSKAVESFGKIKPDEMVTALKGLAIAFAEIAIFSEVTKDSDLIKMAVSLSLVSGAMLLLAGSLKALGNLSWEELGVGLTAMGGSLALMAIALENIKIKTALEAALAIAVVSGSMILLAGVLKLMGNLSWEEIGKGLLTLGVSLALFALALNAMSGTVAASVALAILVGSLTLLVPILALLGNLPWQVIALGLGALAGVFVVLGLATFILTPLVPVMIALSVAITLLAGAALIAGTAMSAFATALAVMAVSGTAGAAVLTLVLTQFLQLIPSFVTALVNAIVQFAWMIANATPNLVAAVMVALMGIVAGLQAGVPSFIASTLMLVISILDTITTSLPIVIEKGAELLVALITGISNKLPEIIPVAIDAVLIFIAEVGKKIPDIIKAGFDLIVNFLDGMANALDNEMPRVLAAVGRVAAGLIDGLVRGIGQGLSSVVGAISGVVQSAIDSAKRLLGIASPSKVFANFGKLTSMGFGDGIMAMGKYVVKSTEDVGDKAINAISGVTSKISDAINDNMNLTPTITPVLDLSQIANGKKDISGMLSGINASGSLNKLSSIASGVSTDGSNVGDAGDTNISFQQNNYSPKALSQFEIYRQTKNQLRQLKGLVPIT